MRCFQPPADTRFYAGVDLHARSLFLCVLDRDGQERCARNLTAAPEPFLQAVQPFRQANLRPASSDVKYTSKRAALTADIADPFVRRRVETHLALLEPLDTTIRRLEAEIEDAAKGHYPTELAVLQSTPGVGPVLSLT